MTFPEGFQQRLDLYTVADRYDVKQYRELFASREAIAAASRCRRARSWC